MGCKRLPRATEEIVQGGWFTRIGMSPLTISVLACMCNMCCHFPHHHMISICLLDYIVPACISALNSCVSIYNIFVFIDSKTNTAFDVCDVSCFIMIKLAGHRGGSNVASRS